MISSGGRFEKKYAVVTGAASGIGRATAERLQAEGATVFGLDCDPCEGAEFEAFLCDVGDEGAVSTVLQKIGERTDCLHALANVAGILTHGPKQTVSELSIENWETVLRVNLTSAMLMLKHCHPLLKAAESSAVVNVSSDQSLKGRRTSAPYGVSKAGMNALTKIAALEMVEDGIRVNAVAPGAVRTDILNPLFDEQTLEKIWSEVDQSIPLGLAVPEDVAALIAFLLSKDASRITGEILLADGGQMLL